jgi:hypothetical protein
MRVCFITTCSSQKIGSGSPYDVFAANAPALSSKLIKIRQAIFRAIRSGHIKGDLRGANEGPDFGGSESGTYLRAFDRYSAGSFVATLLRELGTAAATWLDENKLLFVSGLYGLLESHEPVQNYNVSLENTCEYWTHEIITDAFLGVMGQHKEEVLLVDCCATPLYSNLIDWEQLATNGFTVRRVIGRSFDYRQVRSAAASVATNVDSKYKQERILSGSVFRCVDADIRFVTVEEFKAAQPENALDKPRQRIGMILMEPDDREELLQRFGAGLARHVSFEFVDRSHGEEGLKKLKAAGCDQCLFRILDISHADMRKDFGRDLQAEIRKYRMDPIGFRRFSQLRAHIQLRVE